MNNTIQDTMTQLKTLKALNKKITRDITYKLYINNGGSDKFYHVFLQLCINNGIISK